jgi:hypothetical protein
MTTTGTVKAIWPSKLEKILQTGLLIVEAMIKFKFVFRKILVHSGLLVPF